jgi:tRNA (adenine37-N6)-methyltransferase
MMKQIGTIQTENGFSVQLDKEYAAGLTGLTGFTHVIVLWYAHKTPEWEKKMLVMQAPYRGGPEKMGVFATRSPVRPNGICASPAQIAGIDVQNGIIRLAWIDAENGTPVLDVKPYHPSEDRILSAGVPQWCASWPKSYEESSSFDWGSVFLF